MKTQKYVDEAYKSDAWYKTGMRAAGKIAKAPYYAAQGLWEGVRDNTMITIGALGENYFGPAKLMSGFAVGHYLQTLPHELLHAAGALATGGKVYEIAVIKSYGGDLIHSVLPFVKSIDKTINGEGAGRVLSYGNNFQEFASSMAPYAILTPIGLYLIKRGSDKGNLLEMGIGMSLATAPFLNVNGDFYRFIERLLSDIGYHADSPLEVIPVYVGAALLAGLTYKMSKKAVEAITGDRFPIDKAIEDQKEYDRKYREDLERKQLEMQMRRSSGYRY